MDAFDALETRSGLSAHSVGDTIGAKLITQEPEPVCNTTGDVNVIAQEHTYGAPAWAKVDGEINLLVYLKRNSKSKPFV